MRKKPNEISNIYRFVTQFMYNVKIHRVVEGKCMIPSDSDPYNRRELL